jgi:hypothetical protein
MGSRLLIFDRTCTAGPGNALGLSRAWSAGATLYGGLGRLDGASGVASWDEALGWLARHDRPIAEVQFWGHGKWGAALVGSDALDARALSPRHPLHRRLEAVRERLEPGALVWFRTCETFGASRGLDFARRLSDHLGARVAGHTFIIGFHQSGLHGLAPGCAPDWSAGEGLAEGSPDDPRQARWSSPLAPRTITCLEGRVPEAWFSSRGAPQP